MIGSNEFDFNFYIFLLIISLEFNCIPCLKGYIADKYVGG
jgi:hypothetical protein